MPADRNYLTIPGPLKRQVIQAARDFRKEATPSEALLWEELRGKKLNGIRFRRQQPIGQFIVDFYAPALRLIIEVDGPVHEQQQEADQARQAILESLEMTVLRFSASQVENHIDEVCSIIAQACSQIQS